VWGALGLSVGCGADTLGAGRQAESSVPVEKAAIHTPAANRPPQTPLDAGIRNEFDRVIAQDDELRDREISFVVTNGDVSVSGIVRTEDERRKINDLAMSIDEVKSVANALLVAD
jgi:BON domain